MPLNGLINLRKEQAYIEDNGLCAVMPSVDFQPSNSEGTTKAIKVCRECEIQDMCGVYAILSGQDKGVWGGMSERTRGKINKLLGQAKEALLKIEVSHPLFEEFVGVFAAYRDLKSAGGRLRKEGVPDLEKSAEALEVLGVKVSGRAADIVEKS